MSPDQYCCQRAGNPRSIHYYSLLFLSADRRRALTALFAFWQELRDIADETSDANIARAKLEWWHEELGRVYHGRAQHPVGRVLAQIVRCYGVDEAELQDVITGMAMDLQYNAYPDFEALEVYCRRRSGVVGILSAKVFGYIDQRTLDYASELGVAFQLTTIIRDVGADVRRNRIRLPLHELATHDITIDELEHGRETQNFRNLMDFQIARAHSFYQRAYAKLPAVDRAAQRPGLIVAAIAQTLLREIANDPAVVLRNRVELTPVRMFWIACRTWFSGDRQQRQ
jgi:15-cis-phytoene synthase